MNLTPFITFVTKDLADAGMQLELLAQEEVNGCHGYFDDDKLKRLTICIDHPMEEWVSTLVHEYGHFQQFKERDPLYFNSDLEKFELWLGGKDYKNARKMADCIRLMELDCERRALGNIDTFGIPLDKDRYAQKAAAHIYAYLYARNERKWPDYESERIFRVMPTTLDGAFEKFPRGFKQLFG